MSVYVDDVEIPFRQMLMSHLWADTFEELLEMADKIGLARYWIQGHPTLSRGKAKNASWLHFDVAKATKRRAIAAGAILTDRYAPVIFTATQDLALALEKGDKEGARASRHRLGRMFHARIATMPTFIDVHADQINQPRPPGVPRFAVAVREPIAPPGVGLLDVIPPETFAVVYFDLIDGQAIASASAYKTIADWEKRHKDTPIDRFQLPDWVLKPPAAAEAS